MVGVSFSDSLSFLATYDCIEGTYQTSSPVVSSGYGSLEDEVDELDLSPQTPDTEPFQIEDPKMGMFVEFLKLWY